MGYPNLDWDKNDNIQFKIGMTKSGNKDPGAQTSMDWDFQIWIRTIISISKSSIGYPKPKVETEVHAKI
jgi:hypothetical protein